MTISKFVEGAKEIELDAVANGGDVVASVVTEHIENAGVHSGDASIVLPTQDIGEEPQKRVEDIGKKLARALMISGPYNIQFLAKNGEVAVIEINLRASRTFPFISKVTGIDFISLAVDAFFSLKQKPISLPHLPFVAVKVPQFSFARLTGADPILHVEMASTGEVACFGQDLKEAFLKGELAVGSKIPRKGIFVSLGGDENKKAFLESMQQLATLDTTLFSTEKTAVFLQKNAIATKRLYKIHENKSPNVLEYFQKGNIDLAINLLDPDGKKDESDQYTIRRAAIDHNIPLYTNLQKAQLFVAAITQKSLETLPIKSWNDYTERG